MHRSDPFESSPPSEGIELDLLSGQEFFGQLRQDIAQTTSGDRIAIMTMDFAPAEPLVAGVMDELHLAADRSVDISFGVDAYAFMVNEDTQSFGPLMLPRSLQRPPFYRRAARLAFETRRQALDSLAAKPSVDLRIINEPDRPLGNPYAHRSHIKFAVINDTVRVVGPNFRKSHRADMVLSFQDRATADVLCDLSQQVIEGGSTACLGPVDLVHEIDPATQLLIDVGCPGQSICLERAEQLIQEADEWIVGAFQFFPTGNVGKWLIEAAKNRVEVHAGHNNPADLGLLLGVTERLAILRQKFRMANLIHLDQIASGNLLHTHAIANERAAMGGTFNVTERGVKFGTAEMMVYQQSPAFARRMGDFMLAQLQATGVGAPHQPAQL